MKHVMPSSRPKTPWYENETFWCVVSVPFSLAIVLALVLVFGFVVPSLLGAVLGFIGFLFRKLPGGEAFLGALPWILESILLLLLCGAWGCLVAGMLSPKSALKRFGIPEKVAEKISNRVETVCFFIPGSIVAFFLLKHFLAHS